jgi:hypothetical protein
MRTEVAAEPFTEGWQVEAEQSLEFGAIEGGVGRARGATVSPKRDRFDVRFEVRQMSRN